MKFATGILRWVSKLNDIGRDKLINRIVAFGMLGSMLLSFNLWLTSGEFAKVPVLSDLFAPVLIQQLALVALYLSLVVLLFKGGGRSWQLTILASLALLISGDINRFQPWVFMNALILIILVASETERLKVRSRDWLILLFSSLYIFSGLYKFNAGFYDDVFQWFFEPVGELLRLDLRFAEIKVVAGVVAFYEVLLGFLLLFRRTRLLSVWGLTIFHIFILYVLSPAGHSFNEVVIPWNLAMIAFLYAVFYSGKPKFSISSLKPSIFSVAMMAVLVVLPALGLFGKYDSYPAWSLYSGNVADAYILNYKRGLDSPHAAIERPIIGFGSLYEAETGAPPYPELRVLRVLLEDYCQALEDPLYVGVFFVNKRPLLEDRFSEQVVCTDLL